jgi:hypothetical protein
MALARRPKPSATEGARGRRATRNEHRKLQEGVRCNTYVAREKNRKKKGGRPAMSNERGYGTCRMKQVERPQRAFRQLRRPVATPFHVPRVTRRLRHLRLAPCGLDACLVRFSDHLLLHCNRVLPLLRRLFSPHSFPVVHLFFFFFFFFSSTSTSSVAHRLLLA